MKPFPAAMCSAIMMSLLLGNEAHGGQILDGDFSQAGNAPEPFAGWTTFEAGTTFDRPQRLVDSGNAFASFDESVLGGPGLIGTQLEQSFELPTNARTLSFEFRLESRPGSGSPASVLPDSFQATLFDSSFNPLLPSDPGFFAFYSIDSGTMSDFFDGTVVSVADLGGWRRVTLDVSSLDLAALPDRNVTLEFLLNGLNDGQITRVAVDNVVLDTAAVPEPSALLMATIGIGCVLVACGFQRQRGRDPDRSGTLC